MEEYFDLYAFDGRALGRRKRRAFVHRDGDWHRSIALWVVRANGNLVFQERSSTKDTHPGLLTASVSGHYASGETLTEVLREAKEEVGIQVSEASLVALGTWRQEDRPAPQLIDRELQDVFLWPMKLSLDAFHPDPSEVAALLEVAADALLALLDGARDSIDAARVDAGTRDIRPVLVTAAAFVPAVHYHRAICAAALDYAAGRAPTLPNGSEMAFGDG